LWTFDSFGYDLSNPGSTSQKPILIIYVTPPSLEETNNQGKDVKVVLMVFANSSR